MIGVLLNDRYRLDAELGRGGMGVVYRAHDTLLARDVAVKVLSATVLNAESRARLLREAQAIAKLNHPNIVSVYDAGQADPTIAGQDAPFVVMELVEGESLHDRRPSELEEILSIVRQLCHALEHAHAHGIIHRDLKPENVMIAPDGSAKLMDFGLARTVASRLTAEGAIIGTVFYLAPEQVLGEEIDNRTDLYALGILLYELTTGQLPFTGDDALTVISQHLHAFVDPPSAHNSAIPPDLDALVVRLLSKRPEDRPASAAEVLEMLERLERPDVRAAPATAEDLFLPDHVTIAPPVDWEREPHQVERPVFVARERELERLGESLQTALAGQGRVVFVTGGPGRGKTALMREFARWAMDAHPDLLVVNGDCNAYSGVGDPYLPFRDVMGMLAGDLEARRAAGSITQEQARRLWSALPLAVQALLDHGPYLFDIFVPGKTLLERLTAAAPRGTPWLGELRESIERRRAGTEGLEQSHLFQQFTNVLHALACECPLLLVLDDLQWVDAASAGLLFHLGRRLGASPILITCAYRPEEVALGRGGERHPLEKILAEFKRQFGDVWVDLSQVKETEGRRFVDALLESEPNRLGEAFRQALTRHAGGHPLFTIELLRAMQERGDLVQDEDGRWVEGTSLDWETLPARVEGVIEERIGRLEEELREILTVASVEGEEFTAQVVAQVQQVGERQLLRALSQELEKHHRLVREQGGLEVGLRRLSRYRFAHVLFQRYLYDDLGEGERRLLHREVAKVLEELYQGRTEEVAVQLARHYAGETERERHYARLAGERAAAQFANAEALRYLSRALELTPETDYTERYELLLIREKVYDLLGEREAQTQDLAVLKELADALDDDQKQAEAALRQARYAMKTGDYEMAINSASNAIALAQVAGATQSEAVGCLEWGRVLLRQGDFAGAQLRMEQALALAQTAQLPRVEADCLRGLGNVAAGQGDYTCARALYEEALRLSREIGDPRGESAALNNLGLAAHGQGDFPGARSYYEQALGRCCEMGDRRGESVALLNLGLVASDQGDFPGARANYEQALVRFCEMGDRSGESMVLLNLGVIAAMQSDYAGARASYRESLRLLREIGGQSGECLALSNLGEIARHQGDFVEARRYLEESLRLCRETGKRHMESRVLGGLGLLFHYQGDNETAQDYCEQALCLTRELGLRAIEGSVLIALGHALLRLQRPDKAADVYRQALDLRRDLGEHHLATEPLAGLASAALAQGDTNQALAYVEEILAFLEKNTLYGVEDIVVYLACYQVLETAADPRAKDLLKTAYSLLQERAANISDEQLRRSFFENVPAHREILAAYTQQKTSR